MSKPHRKAQRARNKRYVPKPIRTPMLIGAELVLRPLEQIIDRLEIDGTVDVDGRGTPVFQDGDGQWYEAAGAIEGLMWHIEMLAIRHGMDLPLDGMRELVTAFRYLVPVQPSTMAKLRLAMPELRRVLSMADPDEQISLMRQTQIKAELEAQGVGA